MTRRIIYLDKSYLVAIMRVIAIINTLLLRRRMIIDLSQLHLDWGSSRYKGKVYRSYSLARPLWVDGKNKKETVIKLGKLSDAQVVQWRNLLKALKKPECFLTSFEDICTEKHYVVSLI